MLERWDRHNQRVADWQLHLGQVEPRQGRSPSWPVVLGLVTLAMLGGRVIRHFFGAGWASGVLLVATGACLVAEVVKARRTRRIWEASASERMRDQ